MANCATAPDSFSVKDSFLMCRALQIPLLILLAVSAIVTGCSSQNINDRSQSMMPQLSPAAMPSSRNYEDDSSNVPPLPVNTPAPAPAAEDGSDSFSATRPIKKFRTALFANGIPHPSWNWPATFSNPFQSQSPKSEGQMDKQPGNGIPPAPEGSANNQRRYWLPLSGLQLTAQTKKVFSQEELQQPVALGYEPVPNTAPQQRLAGRADIRQNREALLRNGPADWKDADWLSPTNLYDWNRTHPTQAGPSQTIMPVMSVPEHVDSKDLEQWPYHEQQIRFPQQPVNELRRPIFADEQQPGNILIVPQK